MERRAGRYRALAGNLAYGLKAVEQVAAASPASPEQILTVGCYTTVAPLHPWGSCKGWHRHRLVPDPTPASQENLDYNPRAIPCLRGRSQIRRVYAPERLKYPMKRVGKRGSGDFQRITWDEALTTVADQRHASRVNTAMTRSIINMLQDPTGMAQTLAPQSPI